MQRTGNLDRVTRFITCIPYGFVRELTCTPRNATGRQ